MRAPRYPELQRSAAMLKNYLDGDTLVTIGKRYNRAPYTIAQRIGVLLNRIAEQCHTTQYEAWPHQRRQELRRYRDELSYYCEQLLVGMRVLVPWKREG